MIVMFLVLGTLQACKPEETSYILPDLTGKTEAEVIEILDDYLVTIIIDYEENTDSETGHFSSFGPKLKAGDEYTPGQILTVYIAENYPRLPDLTGKTELEIIDILDDLGIDYQLMIETNNHVTDQTFSRYESPWTVNSQIIDPETEVIVYIGYNDPQLPDFTGRMKHEIITILNDLSIQFTFAYVTDDLYTEDSFASYVDYDINDFIGDGEQVTVNLYKNTFTDATESLFISKYVEGEDNNQAIELYNPLNTAINLADYHIAIYENGSPIVTYTISLTGTLNAKETFVIVQADADQALLDKADLVSNQLLFDGNDVVQLRYKNDTYIDTIYQIGNRLFTLADEIFVRKIDVTAGNRTLNLSEWSAYIPTYFDPIGTHPVAIPETLSFIFIDRDFYDPLGGMILVTLVGINDGDTASFNPGFTDDERVRFLGVDTPETYPVREPWGKEGKDFTTDVLRSATTIYLQSDPAFGTSDTYGRHLAYIWVDGVLLNYELIKNGYSWNYLGTDSKLVYDNRYIHRWFEDAEAYAKANKLGIHS